MSSLRVGAFVAFCFLLVNSSQAQLPDLIYLPFDSAQPPQNLATPGVALNFPPGSYAFGTGMIGTALDQTTCPLVSPESFAYAGDWTIEFWLKSTHGAALPNAGWFQSVAIAENWGIGIHQYYNSPPKLGLGFSKEGWLFPLFEIEADVPLGAWSHFALTYEAATLTLRNYVNGVLVKTKVAIEDVPLYMDGLRFRNTHVFMDDFRIWTSKRSDAEIAAGYNSAPQPLPDDIRIGVIQSPLQPSDCGVLTTNETLSVTLDSFGSTAIPAGTTILWSYSLDGGTAIVESTTLASAMNFRDNLTFSLVTPLDLSVPKDYEITVTCSALVATTNLTTTKDFVISASGPAAVRSFPWVEPFLAKPQSVVLYPLALPLGWEAFFDGNPGNSLLRYRPTGTGGHTVATGSVLDSELEFAGVFSTAYWSGPQKVTKIKTPCIDLSGVQSPQIGLWLKTSDFLATASQAAGLSINIENLDTGLVTTQVGSFPFAVGDEDWRLVTADLSAFVGSRIRAILHFGLSPLQSITCRVQIDDVSIIDLAATGTGQSPQPGAAELEINYSFGSGHDRPRSVDAGPYFAQTKVGDLVNFRFSGEPNQWISLFWGALNPASINYGPIGLCDVGGGYDFATGLPANISVIANGLMPVQPIDFLFKTDINGDLSLNTITPPLPLGSNGAFQALFTTTNGNWFALSNAVELMVR